MRNRAKMTRTEVALVLGLSLNEVRYAEESAIRKLSKNADLRTALRRIVETETFDANTLAEPETAG